MVRKKVTLAFIENNAKRKASYRNRMKGIAKKIKDLSTHCGVEACAIFYGPNQEQPQIWPEKLGDVNEVLKKFMKIPATRRTVNQEEVMNQMIEKLNKQLKINKQLNQEIEVTGFIRGILEGSIKLENLSISDVKDVYAKVATKLEEINRRIQFLGKQAPQSEPALEPEPVSCHYGMTGVVGDCGKSDSD